MSYFNETKPNLDSYWRSIILFGQNSACYKFALAKSLLELSSSHKTLITLEELAVPFSENVLEHLDKSDKQGTAESSKFLDACRKYNGKEISKEDLIKKTLSLGFQNVIDAFHVVNCAFRKLLPLIPFYLYQLFRFTSTSDSGEFPPHRSEATIVCFYCKTPSKSIFVLAFFFLIDSPFKLMVWAL